MTTSHEIHAKAREIKHRVLAEARRHLGYHEGSNNDNIFGQWYGMNHVPWCGEAVSYIAAHAHVTRIIPRFAYTPAGAQFFKDKGRFDQSPRVGDIVFYDTSGLGRISHTGIVEKVNADGSWYALEGNTNNDGSREGCCYLRKLRRTVGHHGGFGHPAYGILARRELGV